MHRSHMHNQVSHQKELLLPEKIPLNQPLAIDVDFDYALDSSNYGNPEDNQPALLIHPAFLHRIFFPEVPLHQNLHEPCDSPSGRTNRCPGSAQRALKTSGRSGLVLQILFYTSIMHELFPFPRKQKLVTNKYWHVSYELAISSR